MAAQIFTEAQDLLPGGVNSPVRAFKSVGGQPIVFDRVEGPYAYDVDGNKYSESWRYTVNNVLLSYPQIPGLIHVST